MFLRNIILPKQGEKKFTSGGHFHCRAGRYCKNTARLVPLQYTFIAEVVAFAGQ
jgi:hypothetical protein